MTTISPGIKSQQITPVTWQAFGYDDLVLDYIGDSTVTTGDRDDRIVVENNYVRVGSRLDDSQTSLAGVNTNIFASAAAYFGANGIFNVSLAAGGG